MLKLSDFDWNVLNNDSSVKSWITTLFQHFKIPTSIALGFLTNKTYSLNNVQGLWPLTQYVYTIMQHGISCNIVDVANQLFFTYQGLTPKLRVFISPPTKLIKIPNFIHALKEKQEVQYEKITTLATFQQYYNPVRRLSPFKPPFLSQSKAFSQYTAKNNAVLTLSSNIP